MCYNETNERLLQESERGDATAVELILRHCHSVDVNTADDWGGTPLIAACYSGHLDVVAVLLREENIDYNKGDFDEITPLTRASEWGYVEIVELLLDQEGINLNHEGPNGTTALITACSMGYSDVAQALLGEEGIDVNKENFEGEAALYLACRNGLSDISKLLLQHRDIDINKEYDGMTALWHAYDSYRFDIVVDLLEHPKTNVTKGNISEQWESQITDILFNDDFKNTTNIELIQNIFISALLGDTITISDLLNGNKLLLNTIDNSHRTPLFLGATRGHSEVVKLLMAASEIQVNAQKLNGATALYQASKYGHNDVVELILEHHNVDVNLATVNKETPLMVASLNGHSEVVVNLLCVVNINTNYASFHGKTALTYAVSKRELHILELLLRCPQTDTSLEDEEYKSALDRAVDMNNSKAIDIFASRGKLQMENGHTCCSKSINRGLHRPVQNNDTILKKFLVCPGININEPNNKGQTPLHLAVKKCLRELVEILLVDRRIDVNKLNTPQNQNALRIAAFMGHLDILKLVLRHDQTFVNMKDPNGDTALSGAIINYLEGWSFPRSFVYFSIVKLLLRCAKTDVKRVELLLDQLDQLLDQPEMVELGSWGLDHIKQTVELRPISVEIKPSCCVTVKKRLIESVLVDDYRAIEGLLQCPGSESYVNIFDTKYKTGKTLSFMASSHESINREWKV